MNTVIFSIAMMLATPSQPLRSAELDIQAIKQHLMAIDRAYPNKYVMNLKDWGIRPVTNLRFLSSLAYHRIYYYRLSTCLRCGVAVIAIDDNYQVSNIQDVAAFNAMLRTEDIAVNSILDAENLAYDFLMCKSLRAPLGEEKQTLGLDIIKSANEIKFVTDSERAREAPMLDRTLGIRPPKLDVHDEIYSLIVYSWSWYSGNIARHTVVILPNLKLDYEYAGLADEVGDFGEY